MAVGLENTPLCQSKYSVIVPEILKTQEKIGHNFVAETGGTLLDNLVVNYQFHFHCKSLETHSKKGFDL